MPVGFGKSRPSKVPPRIKRILHSMTRTPAEILGECPLPPLSPPPFRPSPISYEAALAITLRFPDPITILGEEPLPKHLPLPRHLPPIKPKLKNQARLSSVKEQSVAPRKRKRKETDAPSVKTTGLKSVLPPLLPKKGERKKKKSRSTLRRSESESTASKAPKKPTASVLLSPPAARVLRFCAAPEAAKKPSFPIPLSRPAADRPRATVASTPSKELPAFAPLSRPVALVPRSKPAPKELISLESPRKNDSSKLSAVEEEQKVQGTTRKRRRDGDSERERKQDTVHKKRRRHTDPAQAQNKQEEVSNSHKRLPPKGLFSFRSVPAEKILGGRKHMITNAQRGGGYSSMEYKKKGENNLHKIMSTTISLNDKRLSPKGLFSCRSVPAEKVLGGRKHVITNAQRGDGYSNMKHKTKGENNLHKVMSTTVSLNNKRLPPKGPFSFRSVPAEKILGGRKHVITNAQRGGGYSNMKHKTKGENDLHKVMSTTVSLNDKRLPPKGPFSFRSVPAEKILQKSKHGTTNAQQEGGFSDMEIKRKGENNLQKGKSTKVSNDYKGPPPKGQFSFRSVPAEKVLRGSKHGTTNSRF